MKYIILCLFLLFQLYEQYKSEFEENLVKKTDTLMKEIEAMFPRLAVLDMMDDADNIREYLIVNINELDYSILDKQLKCFSVFLQYFNVCMSVSMCVCVLMCFESLCDICASVHSPSTFLLSDCIHTL